MAVISKEVFNNACQDYPCSYLLHPWNKNCLTSTLDTYKLTISGSAKFYAVVYMVHLLLHAKKLHRKETWVKMGEYYARSTVLGAGVAGSLITLGCTFRKLFGNKIRYHQFVLLPFILNGLFIYLEPPNRRGLVINLFFNLLVEYYLRALNRAGYLAITKSKQVLLFMTGSSLLFYLMRLEGEKNIRTQLFWIFAPEKVRQKSDDARNVCPHEGSCITFVLKGYATYFGLGLAISLVRLLIPQIKTPMKALSQIRGKLFKMALFFGSYIGIYRAVICYFCRKRGFDSALYALPAGYLAGLSIIFNPSLGLSIAALTGAMKLFSTVLYEKKILPEYIPLPEFLYCYCQGTLFNARYMDPDILPGYVFHLMKTVSSGCSDVIFNQMMEAIKNAPTS